MKGKRWSRLAAAVGKATETIKVIADYLSLTGGLDQATAPLQRRPGTARTAQNFEAVQLSGYRRIAGYERYDGRASPSDATYTMLAATITGAPAVGDTLTGLTSAATGVIIALPGSMFVLTKVVGTFVDAESLQIAAVTIATATAAPVISGASTVPLNAQYLNLAADKYRADILAVTGSGAILGGFWLNDINYAFRNNAGGTAAVMFKKTAGGWSAVTFGEEISFSNANTSVGDTDTLTQGAVTATISRVVVQTGTLASGVNTGRLILTGRAGGNYGAGAATSTGGGALTLSAIQTAITLLPSGRFEVIKENFGNAANIKMAYGCDGVNRGWEFDGTTFVPIVTGMTVDAPTHVHAHKKHLFFSFGPSVQHSGTGFPYVWTVITGASELGMGDTVTGFTTVPGSEAGGALAIFTRNRLSMLYGSSTLDWNLVQYRDELGAYAHTIQDVGFTLYLDDRGISDLQTTQAFGNFADSALSDEIKALVNSLRLLAVASCISRDLSQYRLFFTNKQALYMTVRNKKVVGIMPILFTDVVRCAWTSEKNDGSEVMFFGSDDGLVFQMEKGTSFDGDDIEFFIELAYNFCKSPRVIKRFRDVMLEITGNGYAEFNFGYTLGYGTTDLAQPGTQAVAPSFSAVYWDSGNWDNFTWDGSTLAPSILKIEGEASNYSIAVRGSSDYFNPFTLTGAVVQYSPRRRER